MKKFYLFLLATGLITASFAQLNRGTPVPFKSLEGIAGITIYDLQTHNSMSKRYYAYPDGTIGTSWIIGFDESGGWSDRGAAYNYFDGSSWGPVPTLRIQSVRCGGATYAPLGPNGEVNVSYFPTTGDDFDLMISKRDQKGTGTWTESTISGPGVYGIIYPNIVTNGPDHTYIHLLVHTYGAAYNGQENALLYYRSLDGGITWDVQHHEFEDLGATYLTNIDRETWSWAQPVGSTLAFSVGFNDENGYIMKSTDNGSNWQKIPVYENEMSPYPGGEIPPYGGGDGSHACVLDPQGNAHVVFGRMVWTYDAAGTLYYYPSTEGLIYWHEGMPVLDTTTISSYTLEFLEAGGNLVGTVIDNGGTIIGIEAYNSKSMTTYPQMNIDGDNIFVIWSAIAPGFDNSISNFRHICGRSSTDGGATWDEITDYTSDIVHGYMECALPVMAPGFQGGYANFCYWEDPEPGAGVWPSVHAPIENTLITMKVATGFVGTEEPGIAKTLDCVVENFPNPFTTNTTFRIIPARESNLSVRILDVAGQQVDSRELGWIGKAGITFDLPRGLLSGGVYTCIVSDGTEQKSHKILVR